MSGGREPVVDAARAARLGVDLVTAIKDYLIDHDVTYEEYRAAREWIHQLALSGEAPMMLDVLFESAVERNSLADMPGSVGTMQGPYRLEHRRLARPYKLPMDPNERGQAIVFSGTVTDLDGDPICGVLIDTWQSDSSGRYSGFAPGVHEGSLRGIMETDVDGRVEFVSVRPAPYRIPDGGPTGEFLSMIGRHAWRPAHFHFVLSHDRFDTLITQIYFRGDEILEGIGDCVDGVKSELIVDVGTGAAEAVADRYGVDAPYGTVEYTWRLRPRK